METKLKNPVAKQVDQNQKERPILAELAVKAAGRRFLCYECDEELLLRSVDGQLQQHFAHKAQGKCGGYGETTEHKTAKCLLATYPEKFKFYVACRRCQQEIKELTMEYPADTYEGEVEVAFETFRLDAALLDPETGRVQVALEVYQTHEVGQEKSKALTEQFGNHFNEVRAKDVLAFLRKPLKDSERISLLCINKMGRATCVPCQKAAALRQKELEQQLVREAEEEERREEQARIQAQQEAEEREMREKEAELREEELRKQKERDLAKQQAQWDRDARRAAEELQREKKAREEEEAKRAMEWEAERPRREKLAADAREANEQERLRREQNVKEARAWAENRQCQNSHDWVEQQLPLINLNQLTMTRVCANCPAKVKVSSADDKAHFLRTVEFEWSMWKLLLAHQATAVTFRHWTVCDKCKMAKE